MAPFSLAKERTVGEFVEPSLDFPPPSTSPAANPVRMERDAKAPTARERPLWVDHAVPGNLLPSKDSHAPDTRRLRRW